MKLKKSTTIISLSSMLIGAALALLIQNQISPTTKTDESMDYTNHYVNITNNDPTVYQSVKYYVNDIPMQNLSIGQNQSKGFNFYAPESFAFKIDLNGFEEPITVQKNFQRNQLAIDQSWCEEGLETMAPIEVVINSKKNISMSVGEDNFVCGM